ncbi:hypothetical protein HK097_009769 [Rhizophlyctis rosea]|uniref:Protein kinase domain-containing protein n=1 Tax=Rhizophlyctis rosea TaxID=64517 RepID=A0AAD5SGE2_9FUNG|nr:hypothetical protein HK097_009769 [Rhizophlyctis rosea]
MPALVHHQPQMHSQGKGLKKEALLPRRASAFAALSPSTTSRKVPTPATAAPAAGPQFRPPCQQTSLPQTHSQQQQQQHQTWEPVPMSSQQTQQRSTFPPSPFAPPPQHPLHHQHQPQQPTPGPRLALPAEFRKKYILKDELGVGGSGHIFSCVRRDDGKEFAVKLIPTNRIPSNRWVADDEKFGGLIPTEVYIMAKLQHPSLIQFIDYFPGHGIHLIVMELFGSAWKDSPIISEEAARFPVSANQPVRQKAMDLFELLEVRSLNEEESHIIFTQVVDAVNFMLQNGLVHGDIKDENVLVDWPTTPSPPSSQPSTLSTSPTPIPAPRPKAKLIDFGATISLDPAILATTHDFHGTLEFAPPEILLGQFYYPSLADAWSLGVLLYDMVSKGCMPFDTPDDIACPHVRPQPVQASAGCKDILRGLLEKDPKKRMTVEDVVRHPWFLRGPRHAGSSASHGKA